MKKKALLMVLAAALIVAASIGGTLAWLTSTDSVTNTFTVGDLDISLSETTWVNNSKIVPGASIPKNPVVTVDSGSESADIYMSVTVPTLLQNTKITFNVGSNWTWNSTLGCYKYNSAVAAGASTDPLFTIVKIGDLTETEMEAIEAATNAIVVNAYAIQAGTADVSQLSIVAGTHLNVTP
jgi:predicted ribosomally synthesized peptide with SipW-like signal peptide